MSTSSSVESVKAYASPLPESGIRARGANDGPTSKTGCPSGPRIALPSLAAMSSESTESEVLARELDSLGNKLRAVETRLVELEKIIERLEAAALTTARVRRDFRALGHGYRAMCRAE